MSSIVFPFGARDTASFRVWSSAVLGNIGTCGREEPAAALSRYSVAYKLPQQDVTKTKLFWSKSNPSLQGSSMSHGNLCDAAWPGGTPQLAAQTRDSGKEGRQAGLHWDTPGSTQDSLQQLSVTSSASTTPHWKGCMADIERIAYTKKKKKKRVTSISLLHLKALQIQQIAL